MEHARSTLDLTQGELVQATVDDLHLYLLNASGEIASLRAMLSESDRQLGETAMFAADLVNRASDLERDLEKKALEVRSIDSSERPNHRRL